MLKQESKLLKFLGFMWNPLSWVMEIAALMAIALANGGVILCLCVCFHVSIKQVSFIFLYMNILLFYTFL